MLTVATIVFAAALVACVRADVDDVEQATYPKQWLSRYLHTEEGCVANTEYEIFVRNKSLIHAATHSPHRRSRSTLAPSTSQPTAPPKSLSSSRDTTLLP
jgi:hypothetical protein